MTSRTPEPNRPTSSCPTASRPARSVRSRARCASVSRLGASASSVRPASVSSAPLDVRSNSAQPSLCSERVDLPRQEVSHVQPLARTGEVALLGDGEEETQAAQVHAFILGYCNTDKVSRCD